MDSQAAEEYKLGWGGKLCMLLVAKDYYGTVCISYFTSTDKTLEDNENWMVGFYSDTTKILSILTINAPQRSDHCINSATVGTCCLNICNVGVSVTTCTYIYTHQLVHHHLSRLQHQTKRQAVKNISEVPVLCQVELPLDTKQVLRRFFTAVERKTLTQYSNTIWGNFQFSETSSIQCTNFNNLERTCHRKGINCYKNCHTKCHNHPWHCTGYHVCTQCTRYFAYHIR